MIYPRLNRVRSGQQLSVELVNGLIKRTEYAGDLLRQGKCLAGTDISVAQRYDGTTITGGAVEEVSAFRIIDFNGQIYLPIAEENISLVPNKTSIDDYYGIAGDVYFGYTMLSSAPFSRGIITVGEERREILFGDYTRFYGGDESFAVGETYTLDNEGVFTSVFGVKCNLDGSGFEQIVYPKIVPSGEYRNQGVFLSDIYEGNMVGSVVLRNIFPGQVFLHHFLRTPAGNYIDLPNYPWKIYGDYITLQPNSGTHKLYQISTGQTTDIFYNGQNTRLFGIYKNFVNGGTTGGTNTNFLYNINDGTFTDIYGAGEDMG
jgi:hypothetical protein